MKKMKNTKENDMKWKSQCIVLWREIIKSPSRKWFILFSLEKCIEFQSKLPKNKIRSNTLSSYWNWSQRCDRIFLLFLIIKKSSFQSNVHRIKNVIRFVFKVNINSYQHRCQIDWKETFCLEICIITRERFCNPWFRVEQEKEKKTS